MGRRPMGSLEHAVLDVLWDSDEAIKPGDVLARLDIEPALAYSTVQTILRRLVKKNLVNRSKEGQSYLYRPVRTREEQVAETMMDVFSAATDPATALGHFVQRLSPRDASALRQKLRGDK